MLPGFQSWCSAYKTGVKSTEYFVYVFSLYQIVKLGYFVCVGGRASHNPRNLINWLCHKWLSLVFSSYIRNDYMTSGKICKKTVREEKEFIVSVCVGANFVTGCHNTWTTVSAFLSCFEASEVPTWCFRARLGLISDSRTMGSDTTVLNRGITDLWMYIKTLEESSPFPFS